MSACRNCDYGTVQYMTGSGHAHTCPEEARWQEIRNVRPMSDDPVFAATPVAGLVPTQRSYNRAVEYFGFPHHDCN